MPRVLITHWVHPETRALFDEHFELICNDTRESWPRAVVLEHASEADAMMAFMPDLVDEAFLSACPKLKIIGGALKGYDNFDLQACARHHVCFTNVPDLLSHPTAELALTLTLSLLRKVADGMKSVHGGEFVGWQPKLYGTSLHQKRVGMLGLGAVAEALLPMLKAFDCEIYFCEQELRPDLEAVHAIQQLELDALLETSDILYPLLPLTPQTQGLLNGKKLRLLRPGSYLVNVGRGSLVVEADILELLKCGHLAGYAADVFEMEDWARPDRPRTIAEALRQHPNTCLTPHLGSAVDATRLAISNRAAHNILDYFEGKQPRDEIRAGVLSS